MSEEAYYTHEIPMQVIMKACEIPVNSTVTKRTGQKVYTIVEGLTLYVDPPKGSKTREQIPVKAPNDLRILVPLDGSINLNAINGDTELVWHVSLGELHAYLDNQLEESDSK